MSNYTIAESGDLFDPATGKWVGVLAEPDPVVLGYWARVKSFLTGVFT